MSKRQLIDEIRSFNRTALPEFLARFDEVDLNDYLQHLLRSQAPRLRGHSARLGHYVPAYGDTPAATARPIATAMAAVTVEETPASTSRALPWRETSTATALAEPDLGPADEYNPDDEGWFDDNPDATSTTTEQKTRALATTNKTSNATATDAWLF
ncbi:MAG: hypothetical protein FWE88_04135 [Phycisphaerae bacterium]|nr:hypothetical protein [Phycisphaerae bacterium]